MRRNVTDVAYHIAQYTSIIMELREEIMVLRSKIQDQGPRSHASIHAVQCKVLFVTDSKNARLCNDVNALASHAFDWREKCECVCLCNDRFLCRSWQRL